jgi:hypothetical protein
LNQFNNSFTVIFSTDCVIKMLAYGFHDYLTDKMNFFDSIIVVLSLLELTFTSANSTVSAFKSVRIFRIFRVLRVTRLIRQMEYMRIIIKVLSDSVQSFIYIFMLLMLFNFIYALLGMELFGRIGDSFLKYGIRQNFNDFTYSFMSVF